jgi:hypothetical protein
MMMMTPSMMPSWPYDTAELGVAARKQALWLDVRQSSWTGKTASHE